MRNLFNIEKSAFHRNVYVGYACGEVWRIVRGNTQWRAVCRNTIHHTVFADTLTELSDKLANLEGLKS